MPVGFDDFRQPPDDQELLKIGEDPRARKALLPARQVDPFVRGVARLRNLGLLTDDFLQKGLARELLAFDFFEQGVITPQTATLFEPGHPIIDGEIARQFENISEHTIDQGSEVTTFIPKEETEPGGFFRILELFQFANYAIAGGLNALINGAQGEGDQANPFVEFWRGFTLKDKETFQSVFENLGWEGEDGISYWSRWTLGLVSDIIFDPLNVLLLGSAPAGARVLGLAGKLQWRRGAVLFATGQRKTVLKALEGVADDLVTEARAAIVAGEDVVVSGSKATQEATVALRRKLIAVEDQAAAEIRGIGQVGKELSPIEALVGEGGVLKAQEDLVREYFISNVNQTVGTFFHAHSNDALELLYKQSGGDIDKFFGSFDNEFAMKIMEKLLALDGKELTITNFMEWLRVGKTKFLDPGGLKIDIPFTNFERQIVKAEWMDRLKFRLNKRMTNFAVKTAKVVGNTFDPDLAGLRGVVGKVGSVIGTGAQGAFKGALIGARKMGSLFGVDRRKSQLAESLFVQRATSLHDDAAKSLFLTQGTLRFVDPDGKFVTKITDPVTKEVTKIRHSPLPEEVQEVIYDAIQRENEAAREWIADGNHYFGIEEKRAEARGLVEAGRADEAEGILEDLTISPKKAGYQEQHIHQIINDPKLAGYTDDQKEQILEISRNIEKEFRNLYDDSAREGLDIAFQDFYLPYQYDGIEKSEQFRFAKRVEAFKGNDIDPFVRLRTLTLKEAEEAGLTPVKDLARLVFGRFFAARRAATERIFAQKFTSTFAIHGGQVDDLLVNMYGPSGRLGTNIIKSIRGTLPTADLFSEHGIIEAIPKLKELKDLVEQGKLTEAAEWIESGTFTDANGVVRNNFEVLSPAMLVDAEGEAVNIFEAFRTSLFDSLGAINDHMNVVSRGQFQLAAELSDELAPFLEEFTAGRIALIKRTNELASPDSDLVLAQALSRLTVQRVAKILNLSEGAQGFRLRDLLHEARQTAGSPSLDIAKQTGDVAAAHVAILDEMMLATDGRVTPQLLEAVEERLGGELDKAATRVAELVDGVSDSAIGGKSARPAKFDEREAVLMARMLWPEVLENAVVRGKVIVPSEFREQALLRASREIQALLSDGRKEQAMEVANRVYDQLGTHEILSRVERLYRRKNGLPEGPLGDLTEEVRAAVLKDAEGILAQGKRARETEGVQFFRESLFLPAQKAVKQIRGRVKKNVLIAIGALAGPDKKLFEELKNLVFQRAASRSGFHFQPMQGIKGALLTAHGGEANRFLDTFRRRAREASPELLVKAALDNKLEFNWLVRDTLRAPLQLNVAIEKVLVAQTEAITEGLRQLAKISGSDTFSAVRTAQDFSRELQRVTQLGPGVNLTDIALQTDQVFETFGGRFTDLFRDHEMQGVIGRTVDEYRRALNATQIRVGRISKGIEETQSEFRRILSSPTGFYGLDDILPLRNALDDQIEEVRELIEQVELEAGRVFVAPLPPLGERVVVKKFLKDDAVVGTWLAISEDLRRGATRLPRDVAANHKARMVGQARAHLRNAEGVVDKMREKADALLPLFEKHLKEVRFVESAVDGVVETSRRQINAILEEVTGQPVDIFGGALDLDVFAKQVSGFKAWRSVDQGAVLRSFLGLTIADEFLQGGKMTREAWEQTIENLFTRGPQNEIFREFWDENLAILRTEGLRELVEDFFLSTAPSRLTAGRLVTEFEWAAKNRLAISIPPQGQAKIAEAALRVWNEAPEIREVLDFTETFTDAVLDRYDSILSSRGSTTGWLEEFSDAAFLRSEELASLSRQAREESAYIEAFDQVVNERRNALALRELEQPRQEIANKIFRATKQGNESSAELVALKAQSYGSAGALVNRIRAAEDFLDVRVELEALGLDRGTFDRIRRATDIDRQVDEFLGRFDKALDGAYDDAFAQLDDMEGFRRIKEQGTAQTIAGAMRDQQTDRILALREGNLEALGAESESLVDALMDLDPPVARIPSRELVVRAGGETIADEARYMADAVGADRLTQGTASAKRAQYWMWRLGFFTTHAGQATGTLGLPAKSRVAMLRAIQKYGQTDAARKTAEGLVGRIRKSMVKVINENEAVISSLRLAETEVAMFRKFLPEIEASKSMQLQFGPEHVADFKAVQHLRNYLSFQALRYEHAAMTDLIRQLPTLEELQILSLKALVKSPEEGANLTAKNALLGADLFANEDGAARTLGAALTPEQLRASRALGIIEWETIEANLEDLLSRSGKRILDKLNVNLLDHPTEAGFLNALAARGVEGIEVAEDGTATIVGRITHPEIGLADELDSAVNEIVAYLKLNKGDNLPISISSMPATEIQLRTINKALENTVDNEEARSLFIYALSSTTRIDKLSVGEATYVIENLERHLTSKLGKGGEPLPSAAQIDPDKLALAEAAKGYAPTNVKKIVDDTKDQIKREANDIGTDDQMVPVSFAHFEHITDRWGRPVDTKKTRFLIKGYLWRSLKDEVFRDRFIENESFNTLFRNFADPMTNWYKELQTLWFPAFHSRNVVDASIRASFAIGLKAFDMKRNIQLWRLLSGKPGTIKVRGKPVPNEIVREWIRKAGLEVDFTEKVGMVGVGLPGTSGVRHAHQLSERFPWSQLGAARTVVRNIAGQADNTFRLSLWLDALDRGMPVETAARWTQKFLFDYAYGLTPFERDVMRRMFPFYTFSRFNVPLALETMFKRPGLISALGKTRFLLGNSEDDNIERVLPAYVREQWRFRPRVVNGELRVISGRNLVSLEDLGFLGDLATWRSGELRGGFFREVLSRLNPMIKLVPEWAIGHNFFFDRRIVEDETVKRALLDWPVIRDYLQMRKVRVGTGSDAKVYWRMNGFRMHALQSTHLGRIYRTVSETFAEDDLSAVERFLPFITGLRITKVDLERRRDHLIARSNFQRAKILRALRQGDHVALQRLSGTVERPDEEAEKVAEEFKSLQELVPPSF